MKTKVSFRIPLTVTKHAFHLLPPCTCCGKPVEELKAPIYLHHQEYTFKTWRVNRKGYPSLAEKRDAQGNPLKGSVDIHIPYCLEHITPSLSGFYKALDVSIFLGALLLTIGLIAGGVIDVPLGGLSMIAIPLLTFFGSLFVVFLISMGIRSLITQMPRFQDYPIGEGSWGLEINIVTDSGKQGSGPIQYFLVLNFANAESARRFYESSENPVEVTIGKEFLMS